MCGIAGYLGLSIREEDREPLLRKMCSAIIHRGPDDDGYYTDSVVGLGMRRLSIIDLSTGHQPIHSADGKKHIVFNGEIYNYRELRQKLINNGYPFSTDSDTEVIVAEYQQNGYKCLQQLNGMFAFALWDEITSELFLARDRMGVKPLYYYWDGFRFLFASEIKALLASDLVSREINFQAVWDFLTFRYIPQPQTIWKNIFKLPPGHFLTLRAGADPVIQQYWEIPYTDDTGHRSEEQLLDEFSTLFLDAVRLRLIADVPVGILLSGGLDSSAVAAAVAEIHNARLSSFSVAFADSVEINEFPYARMVAERTGTDHHEIVINEKDFCDFLPDFVRFTDEPLADLASIPLYYVSRLARESVTVVLSGEGSDEILGGYDFDYYVSLWDRRRSYQKLPNWLKKSSLFMGGYQKILGRSFDQGYIVDEGSLDLRRQDTPPSMTNHLDSAQKKRLFRGESNFSDSLQPMLVDLKRLQTSDPLNQYLYMFSQSWLVDDLLMKADRMSMANSLELRTPFLDYRLVEWAAKAPPSVKVRKNGDGTYVTKSILRQFAAQRLPVEILTRPKLGFPVPLYNWVTDRLKPWAFDLLDTSSARINSWLEPSTVQDQLRIGTDPGSAILDRHRLWDLLILELWSREWLQP
jgi:asparagine synthase (glutamine-hydrolysing)